MHVITRIGVLFLWMHMLTLVKSQDCTLRQFLNGNLFDSNFDTTDLEASYPGGKQVRVSCNVGYSGFFKLLCIEGKWQSRGTPCQPRSCGHPGDAQFADFQLEKGDDFVFGSQVLYTCQKGYQMVSRINYRRCMAEGWDGVVPVCEAQQCSVILVGDNVQVNGDPEEATYGNVVRFSCKSNTEILIGSPEMYCDENGEWSGQPPKCDAIKCTVPMIENGEVPGDIQAYHEHDVLHFSCNPGYKRVEARLSKCTKRGQRAEWSPTPLCELITCKLLLPPLGGTRYERTSSSVFSPGDTVRVICGEKHSIVNPQDTSAVTTCKADGQWTIEPVCSEVRCSNERPQSVHSWDVRSRDRITLGETKRYWCKTGYKRTGGANRATCSRDGWKPDPLCQEITCKTQYYENADIDGIDQQEYRYNAGVEYVCNAGYEGRFTLTCRETGWIGSSGCRRRQCKKLHIDNAQILGHEKGTYMYDENAQYACKNNDGRRFTITCGQSGWTGIQNCSACLDPDIPHGFAVRPHNDTLYYACKEGYKLSTKGWWAKAKCNDGKWSALEECIENRRCGEIPVIPNGRVTPSRWQGESAGITCHEGYDAQVDTLTCRGGKWHSNGFSPKTICTPTANPCNPPSKVENAVVVTPYQKEYLSGSAVAYQCRDKHTTMDGEDTILCQNGTWEMKEIKCTLITCKLLLPPPKGTWYGRPYSSVFSPGGTVRVICGAKHWIVNQKDTTAVTTCKADGKWTIEPVCSAYCDKLEDVTMTFTADQERYKDGDVIKYQCIRPDVGGNATCLDTKWNKSEECEVKPCQLPDDTPNGYYQIIHGEEFVFGTTIQYFCNEGYQMVSRDDTRTCLLDKWTNHVPICDPLSCDPPPADGGVTVEGLPENAGPILPDRFLTFSCDGPGKYLNGSSVLICGKDGQWDNPFPSCEDIICELDVMQHHLNVDGLPPKNETMKIGHKLQFHCDDQFTLEGSAEIECLQTGKWNDAFPTCSDTCKVAGVSRSVRLNTHVPHNQLRKGQKLRFGCTNWRDTLRGNAEVECLAGGQWSDPFPTCGAPLGCRTSPPPLADGDTTETRRFQYGHGESVEYACQNLYKMEGDPHKTCRNGEWVGEMRCLKPCTVDREVMNTHNIQFLYGTNDKLYCAHDDVIQFRCKGGRRHVGRVGMSQKCIDGVMPLPTCH
ncbi:complement factor H-like isoform X2 [Sebastes fasciatus]|uniref:complement factor H-like isoform X2 n=1 Tax=Sebastes fasciatus TaxID=394691 RepID=UPI003D9F2ABC